jgi:hypothetical protein
MKAKITFDGKEYPIKMTMGAMLRYEQETGKKANDVGDGVVENTVLLWCCIKSACAHDKVAFDVSLMDFADNITPDDFRDMTLAVSAGSSDTSAEEGDDAKNAV